MPCHACLALEDAVPWLDVLLAVLLAEPCASSRVGGVTGTGRGLGSWMPRAYHLCTPGRAVAGLIN